MLHVSFLDICRNLAQHGILFSRRKIDHVLKPRNKYVAPTAFQIGCEIILAAQNLDSSLHVDSQAIEYASDKRSRSQFDKLFESRKPCGTVRPLGEQAIESFIEHLVRAVVFIRERSCGLYFAPRIKFTTSRAPRPWP